MARALRTIMQSILAPVLSTSLYFVVFGAAIGSKPNDLQRAIELDKAGVDILFIDTAHGHSSAVLESFKKIRKKINLPIVVGNIATPEAAKDLIKLGADAIKVGIGPGSICTTRIVAGVGVPQFTAIQDIASITNKNKIPMISDGGIRYSGDIVKALAAGAETVMIGSLFAGTDETPGQRVIYQGRAYKLYRGMGSMGAMVKGSKDRYGQGSVTEDNKLVPEGIEGQVPYKGAVENVLHQLLGGLRAAMGYTGNSTIEAMQTNCKFRRSTEAGRRESHVHDVTITREAPNYRKEN